MTHKAKLNFIKRSSQRSIFRNVPKSDANCHHYWLAHKLEFCDSIVTVEQELSKPKRILLSSEPLDLIRMFEVFCTVTDDLFVSHHKWAQVQNTLHKRNMFLLIKYDCLFPQFGKIVDIIVYSGIIVFYVEI